MPCAPQHKSLLGMLPTKKIAKLSHPSNMKMT